MNIKGLEATQQHYSAAPLHPFNRLLQQLFIALLLDQTMPHASGVDEGLVSCLHSGNLCSLVHILAILRILWCCSSAS